MGAARDSQYTTGIRRLRRDQQLNSKWFSHRVPYDIPCIHITVNGATVPTGARLLTHIARTCVCPRNTSPCAHRLKISSGQIASAPRHGARQTTIGVHYCYLSYGKFRFFFSYGLHTATRTGT